MKIIQLVSLTAAAGLIAGCSSTRDQASNGAQANPPSAANQSSYNPSGNYADESKQVTIDQLPQAAQTTVKNQIGDQQIEIIKQETRDGQAAYKVELQKKGFFSARPSLLVSSDGSVLKESHLPQNINEAAGAQAPQSQTMGSEANPSGATPGATNSVSGQQ